MKFIKWGERSGDGRYLVSAPSFIFYLLTSAIGIALLFCIGYVYFYNAGSYLQHVDLIFFFGKDYSPDELHYVADHEIGHHIWFQELSEKERNEYINIYEDSNYYITEYSKTNVEENFAEEYAFYRACNNNYHCLSPDRIAFFQDYLSGYKIVVID